MAASYPLQPPTKQVLLTLRLDHVEALDRLVSTGAASNRSDLVDKIIGGFIADLRNRQQNQQNQQSALGSFIAFLLMVVGIAAIVKALGGED
jgi:hypothetical protein